MFSKRDLFLEDNEYFHRIIWITCALLLYSFNLGYECTAPILAVHIEIASLCSLSSERRSISLSTRWDLGVSCARSEGSPITCARKSSATATATARWRRQLPLTPTQRRWPRRPDGRYPFAITLMRFCLKCKGGKQMESRTISLQVRMRFCLLSILPHYVFPTPINWFLLIWGSHFWCEV